MRRRQRGQAMTEFTVAAGLVLIPAFLLIPLLGKYIDMRHSTIQAARYEAWEYTVWHASDTPPDGFTQTLPVKDAGALQREAHRRFLSDPARPLDAADKVNGWSVATRNVLWQDHRGTRLYDGDNRGSPAAEEPTPDALGIVTPLLHVLDAVFSALASALDFLGIDAGFTAIDADGYYQAESGIKTARLDWFDPDNRLSGVDTFKDGLTFTAQAGVLSQHWNAGSSAMAAYQTRGLVPTALLDNEVMRTAQTVLGVFAPELKPNSLRFGYVDYDSVPPDRLKPTTQAVVCDEESGTGRGLCEIK